MRFYCMRLFNWTPFSPLAAAFFVWLALIVLTGGIHLDGWMDASDAFFSYRDKQKRLEIMKDPQDRSIWCSFGYCVVKCAFFVYL